MNFNVAKTRDNGFLKSTCLLGCLAILIYFANAILHSTSDTLVILTRGKEAFAALKLQLIIPNLAILGIFLLCYRFDRIKTFFYVAGSTFFVFFGFMAISNLMVTDKAAQNHLVVTINYFMSHLWPVMYALLFWVAANQTLTTKQASISYPIILFLISLATFPANSLLRYTQDISVLYTIVSCCIIGMIALCNFQFKDSKIEPECSNNRSFSLCQKISYASLLALIFVCGSVVGQGLNVNLKFSAYHVFSNAESYTHFLEVYSMLSGSIAMIVSLMTCWFAWAFGWRFSSLVIPVVCLLLLGVYWDADRNPMAYAGITAFVDGFPQESASVLIITVITGIFQGLSILFITTKMMAFIPLPSSTKARAFAFITIIFGGQAISKFVFSLNLAFSQMSTNTNLYPVIIALFIWIAAVHLLANRYNALSSMEMNSNNNINHFAMT